MPFVPDATAHVPQVKVFAPRTNQSNRGARPLARCAKPLALRAGTTLPIATTLDRLPRRSRRFTSDVEHLA